MVTGVLCRRRKGKARDEEIKMAKNSYSTKYQFPRGIGLEDDRRAIGGYGRQGEMALL
jgi:hypothetical protein